MLTIISKGKNLCLYSHKKILHYYKILYYDINYYNMRSNRILKDNGRQKSRRPLLKHKYLRLSIFLIALGILFEKLLLNIGGHEFVRSEFHCE